MYYIYYVKEFNKIGCTADPEKRMEKQQGLIPWADYVIDTSEDLDEASHLEAYYKGKYDCHWDGDIYMNQGINFNKKQDNMKLIVNKTGTSRYFGQDWLPKHQIISAAPDGIEFQIDNMEYCSFTQEELTQLVSDGVIQSSQYNPGFYAVPKALLAAREALDEKRMDVIGQNGNEGLHYGTDEDGKGYVQYPDFAQRIADLENKLIDEKTCQKEDCCEEGCIQEFEQIRRWAEERGLYAKGDNKTQMVKLIEEVGETAKAILKSDEPEIIDGLGDILVVLINLSHLSGYKLEDCLASAYDQIKNRKGSMKGGTFVKEE